MIHTKTVIPIWSDAQDQNGRRDQPNWSAMIPPMARAVKTDPGPRDVVDRVARNLRWVREIKSPSAAQTARDLGLENANQWNRYENGKRRPDMPLLIKFCDLYGCTLEFIFRDKLTGLDEELRMRLVAMHPELVLGGGSQSARPDRNPRERMSGAADT